MRRSEGVFPRVSLEAHAQPSMAILLMRVAARGDRIGKDKERAPLAPGRIELSPQEVKFVLQHRL